MSAAHGNASPADGNETPSRCSGVGASTTPEPNGRAPARPPQELALWGCLGVGLVIGGWALVWVGWHAVQWVLRVVGWR